MSKQTRGQASQLFFQKKKKTSQQEGNLILRSDHETQMHNSHKSCINERLVTDPPNR